MLDSEIIERLAAKEREVEEWKQIAASAQHKAHQLTLQVRLMEAALSALRDL